MNTQILSVGRQVGNTTSGRKVHAIEPAISTSDFFMIGRNAAELSTPVFIVSRNATYGAFLGDIFSDNLIDAETLMEQGYTGEALTPNRMYYLGFGAS